MKEQFSGIGSIFRNVSNSSKYSIGLLHLGNLLTGFHKSMDVQKVEQLMAWSAGFDLNIDK